MASDELFEIRNALQIGAFQTCINEAEKLNVSTSPPPASPRKAPATTTELLLHTNRSFSLPGAGYPCRTEVPRFVVIRGSGPDVIRRSHPVARAPRQGAEEEGWPCPSESKGARNNSGRVSCGAHTHCWGCSPCAVRCATPARLTVRRSAAVRPPHHHAVPHRSLVRMPTRRG